jgi:hypothetical protein
MQARLLSPILQRKRRIRPQGLSQCVWPVIRLNGARRQTFDQSIKGFDWIPLAGASDLVGVGDRADRRALPFIGYSEHQHLGAWPMKAVEMAFEKSVENHVAGADTVAAGIPRLVITARQNDRGECLAVAMARQGFAGCVPHSSGRGVAETAM